MGDILALDLGTNVGFAYNMGDSFCCGTWVLASPKCLREQKKTRANRRQDIRVIELYRMVKNLSIASAFDCILFEDVQFSSSTAQTQLWSSLRTAVWIAAFGSNTLVECVPTGTLKKFATGSGAAKKEQMGVALCRRYSDFVVGKNQTSKFKVFRGLQELDDNAVDAVWLWKWGQTNLSRKPDSRLIGSW